MGEETRNKYYKNSIKCKYDLYYFVINLSIKKLTKEAKMNQHISKPTKIKV